MLRTFLVGKSGCLAERNTKPGQVCLPRGILTRVPFGKVVGEE